MYASQCTTLNNMRVCVLLPFTFYLLYFIFLFYYRHFHRQFYASRTRGRDRIQSYMCTACAPHNSNAVLYYHNISSYTNPFSEGIRFLSVLLFLYFAGFCLQDARWRPILFSGGRNKRCG